MKVLHNSRNMCTLDLTDMYAFAFSPAALKFMLVHIRTYSVVKSLMHIIKHVTSIT